MLLQYAAMLLYFHRHRPNRLHYRRLRHRVHRRCRHCVLRRRLVRSFIFLLSKDQQKEKKGAADSPQCRDHVCGTSGSYCRVV